MSLRQLPSVDQILQSDAASRWIARYGRPLTLAAIREVLEGVRAGFRAEDAVPSQLDLQELIDRTLLSWTAPSLIPVINASGVVLHTNLGRSPLSQAAIQAVHEIAQSYSNLEYDLEKGQRGSRLVHAEALLSRLTGAQAALVVNNNAAAVLLVLTVLAQRKAVVIARTQLVEIGGGFRVPDVMKQSGARLLEIGTTNRVHLSDYENALEEKPALILRAHRSNFQIVGFTSEPDLVEIAGVARRVSIPLIDDLGSGSLLDTARFGLSHEPMVQESLVAGADLVCFSGDKLLGGPQAGIIVGKADLIARLKKHPLARAIRADKLCLAALSATLLHYLKNEAELHIPVWRMLSASPESLQHRAATWRAILGQGEVIAGESTIGGGSLPGENQPTYLLAIQSASPNRALARLRQQRPAVIARVQDGWLVFDPRTVLPEQEAALLAAIRAVIG